MRFRSIWIMRSICLSSMGALRRWSLSCCGCTAVCICCLSERRLTIISQILNFLLLTDRVLVVKYRAVVTSHALHGSDRPDVRAYRQGAFCLRSVRHAYKRDFAQRDKILVSVYPGRKRGRIRIIHIIQAQMVQSREACSNRERMSSAGSSLGSDADRSSHRSLVSEPYAGLFDGAAAIADAVGGNAAARYAERVPAARQESGWYHGITSFVPLRGRSCFVLQSKHVQK